MNKQYMRAKTREVGKPPGLVISHAIIYLHMGIIDTIIDRAH